MSPKYGTVASRSGSVSVRKQMRCAPRSRTPPPPVGRSGSCGPRCRGEPRRCSSRRLPEPRRRWRAARARSRPPASSRAATTPCPWRSGAKQGLRAGSRPEPASRRRRRDAGSGREPARRPCFAPDRHGHGVVAALDDAGGRDRARAALHRRRGSGSRRELQRRGSPLQRGPQLPDRPTGGGGVRLRGAHRICFRTLTLPDLEATVRYFGDMERPLVYVSKLVRLPLLDAADSAVGRVSDVVLVPGPIGRAPQVTGFVATVQRRTIFVNARRLARVHAAGVALRSGTIDIRQFDKHGGELLAVGDILKQRFGTEIVNDIGLRPVESRTPGWEVATVSLRPPGTLRRRGRPRVVAWWQVGGLFDVGELGRQVAELRTMH